MIASCFSRKYFARFLGTFIFSVALLSTSVIRGGCAGDLDPTFGTGGKVRSSAGPDFPRRIAIQCDGKIVTVGEKNFGGDIDAVVARVNADGSFDTTFGSNGIKRIQWSIAIQLDTASDIAIQCDGKIVVVGQSGAVSQDFAVARLNPDGSFDESFTDGAGLSGRVTFDMGSNNESGNAVAIQCDGKIVVGGTSGKDFAAARLNPDGSLDPTFTDGVTGPGKVKIDLGGTNFEAVNSVAIQCDGKIILAGHSDKLSLLDFAIVRLNPDGSLDQTFGGIDGTDAIPGTLIIPDTDAGTAVALQCDGKIIFAGVSSSGNNGLIIRLNPDGSFDTSFAGEGKQTIDFGGTDVVEDVAIQCDGKIVVGARTTAGGGGSNFAVARLNPDGSFDNSFNGDGKVIIDVSGTTDQSRAIAIQCDGKIVQAGDAAGKFGMIRLLPGCLPEANAQQSGGTKTITTKANKAVVVINVNKNFDGDDAVAGDHQVIDIHSLKITKRPSHGVVVVNPDLGTVMYYPEPGFFGTDHFKYTVGDARVCCCCCPCGPCPPCFTDGTEVVGSECLVPCERAFACSDPATCDPCKHCSDCALDSPEATVQINVTRRITCSFPFVYKWMNMSGMGWVYVPDAFMSS